MADTQSIEQALDDLRLEVPAGVARARATLDALSTLDIPLRAEISRAELAARVRVAVERREAVDPVVMVAANRAGANNTEAAAVVQQAVEDAQRLLDLAIVNSGREILTAVRSEIEAIYGDVRKLPTDTPSTSDEAVDADEPLRKAHVALKQAADRHSGLRWLWRLVVADAAHPSALTLFADTKLGPLTWPSLKVAGVAAGPSNPLARLRWLTTPEAEAWVPDVRELNDFYWAALHAMEYPNTERAVPLPMAATVTPGLEA